MRALDRKLIRDLVRLRGQVVAIAAVIACGIAMLVMTSGTLRSLEDTRAAYYERYRFADLFAGAKRAPRTLVPRLAAIPGVARVETRVVFGATVGVEGFDEPILGRLISLPESRAPALNVPYLRRGRWPAPFADDEALASEAFAEAHGLVPGDRISALINGHWRRLTIVGTALSPEYVYAVAPGAMLPDDKRFAVLWMGAKALAAATDLEDAFNDVSFALTAGASVDDVIARVDRLLAPYGGRGAYARKDQVSHWFIEGELDELRILGLISPGIFLTVAAFLLNVVTSRLIATEREQIGIFKACGYGNGAVAAHYLKLTAAIVLLGSCLGIAVGAWLGYQVTQIYTGFFRFPLLEYRLTAREVAIALLVSGGPALLGALGAMRRAAALAPAEAMRPAAPLSYRRTLAERLGLSAALTQPARMVLRHLERRPARAFFSILGIAASVALIVAAMFSMDSVEFVLAAQADILNREDVAVTFVEPRGREALNELGHAPGVLRAEPYRAVPVRLRAGARSKRTTLLGVSEDARLRRLMDADLNPIPLPEHGVMLSAKLAELLAVAPGQTVTAEVMEGRRPVRTLRVSGVVDDYLGTTAYLDLRALNRLMYEGPVISGAYLEVDETRQKALYARLKTLPAVASVTVKAAMIDTFREMLSQNALRIIGMNIIFATLIATGVVYNGARISLSERRRELASLRVMGFSRGEVAAILLGELMLLTVIALPLGCVLGYGLAWLISLGLDRELYRFPFVVEHATFGWAVVAVIGATVASALHVKRRLDREDLVATLKTRE